ncbi:hypothetical protein [Halogeometricum borinquense]|uniref:hypothetical protein n=1 Tax=Halogeometricum borinquense TaxID=60847 RepID=UPI0034406D51
MTTKKKVELEGEVIRWPSILMLQIVRDNAGAAETSYIVRHLPEDESWASRQGVKYRMDDRLIPLNLAEKAEQVAEKDGSTIDGNIYRITDEGRDFLDLYGPDFEDAISMAEASKSLQRTRRAVDGLVDRIEDAESGMANEVKQLADHLDAIENRLDSIQSQQEATVNAVDEDDARIRDLQRRIDATDAAIEDVDERVDAVKVDEYWLAQWVSEFIYGTFASLSRTPRPVQKNPQGFEWIQQFRDELAEETGYMEEKEAMSVED